jgi:hypothetical protein
MGERSSLRWILLAAVILTSTAACDSTYPAQRAYLRAEGGLGYDCGVSCRYQGEARNSGTGCALRVRGVTRIHDGSGREIGRDEWSLDPARRVRQGETFLFEGCCFSLGQVNFARSSRTEISWDDTSC